MDSSQETVAQGFLFMEFSKQEYLSGLLFPTPGDLPNPGIEPMSPASPALAGRFFTTEPSGKPHFYHYLAVNSDRFLFEIFFLNSDSSGYKGKISLSKVN